MQEIICIVCPKGCHLQVDENNDFAVTGSACEKGIDYGRNELQNPVRVLTSMVKIAAGGGGAGAAGAGGAGDIVRCPVRTDGSIPKALLSDAMKLIDAVELTAPVNVGDVVIANILGTGVDVIATRTLNKSRAPEGALFCCGGRFVSEK